MLRLTFFASVSLVVAVAWTAAAAANAPLRHLEFNYETSGSSTTEQHGSGLRDVAGVSGSDIARSTGNGVDRGTIEADVLSVTQDGGLIIMTSQEGSEKFAPVEIAVKGDGSILTPANTSPTQEQRYVLSFLGRGIIPFTEAPVGKTWSVSQQAPSGTTDLTHFRITGIEEPIVHLAIERTIEARSGMYHMSITGTIDYNYKLDVPIAGSLHLNEQNQTGNGLRTTTSLLTFSLEADSFAKLKG